MICELTIFLKPEEEKNNAIILREISSALYEKKIKAKKDEIQFVVIKKSIDARHKQIKIVLRLKVFINEKISSEEFSKMNSSQSALPTWKKVESKKSVLIIGSGPAGLFAALRLLEDGIKPIIIERGKETSARKIDIAAISTKNLVDENSNYCFGEGGAGTFSDGKLYTRSNKRGDISRILKIFNHFGADEKILTDAHPHIGTDKLPKIINAMREKIISLGGEFYFNTKCVDFIFDENSKNENSSKTNSSSHSAQIENSSKQNSKNLDRENQSNKKIVGVKTFNIIEETYKDFFADSVILATGHSATDIYLLLAQKAPDALEAKTFAAGVRVEHPRELIDAIQYHGENTKGILPTAEYRLTTQVDGRGVYSFCMCPGGFVVPSSSAKDEIVVNGMSTAKRNSAWSNAAIVVEIRPEDVPEEFQQKAKNENCKDLAGLYFRQYIEKLTAQNGKGQAAPAQRLTDFLAHKESADLPESSYTPGLVSSKIDSWMPAHIESRLEQGFKDFEKSKKGFVCRDAVIIASETRTSTPVRIARDKESFECVAVKNLFPAGEGSGYSGGIVSSAMDGENVASKIVAKLK